MESMGHVGPMPQRLSSKTYGGADARSLPVAQGETMNVETDRLAQLCQEIGREVGTPSLPMLTGRLSALNSISNLSEGRVCIECNTPLAADSMYCTKCGAPYALAETGGRPSFLIQPPPTGPIA